MQLVKRGSSAFDGLSSFLEEFHMWDVGPKVHRDYYGYAAQVLELTDAACHEHASNNMKAFLCDMEKGPREGFRGLSYSRDFAVKPIRNRYRFELNGMRIAAGKSWGEGEEFSHTVWMPGIALPKVRYVCPENQNQWDFPKLLIGSGRESGVVVMNWLAALNFVGPTGQR